jgi:hypothetical protein
VIFEQASWFIFAVALLWRRENQVAGGEYAIGTIGCGFQRSVQLGYVAAGNAGSTHPARCCTRCSALPLPTLRTSGVSHRIPRPPSFALFFVESWDDGHSVNATAFLFVHGIGVASIFLVSRIETSRLYALPVIACTEASPFCFVDPRGGAFLVKCPTYSDVFGEIWPRHDREYRPEWLEKEAD